jgi:hypothetical protein
MKIRIYSSPNIARSLFPFVRVVSIYSKPCLIRIYNSKFRHDSNFSLNLGPKEEKFTQIYLVISKTLIIRNSNEKSAL